MQPPTLAIRPGQRQRTRYRARRRRWPMSIILSCACALFPACEVFSPDSGEDLAKALERAEEVGRQADALIDDAINTAVESDAAVDVVGLAQTISKIRGVRKALANQTGSAIMVEQTDGLRYAILLAQENDPRLFEEVVSPAAPPVTLPPTQLSLGTRAAPRYTRGETALILAPFQRTNPHDLDGLERQLVNAGLHVTRLEDEAADLAAFDMMSDYDVVIIHTHGTADATTRAGERSGALMTGQRWTKELKEELDMLHDSDSKVALGRLKGMTGLHVMITAPFVTRNLTEESYSGNWIYAGACESAETLPGVLSLRSAFQAMGVGAYSGYTNEINSVISGPIREKLVDYLVAGMTLHEATALVRADPGLRARAWWNRLEIREDVARTIDVSLLDSRASFLQDDYFIFNPAARRFAVIGAINAEDPNHADPPICAIPCEKLHMISYNGEWHADYLALVEGGYFNVYDDPERSQTWSGAIFQYEMPSRSYRPLRYEYGLADRTHYIQGDTIFLTLDDGAQRAGRIVPRGDGVYDFIGRLPMWRLMEVGVGN